MLVLRLRHEALAIFLQFQHPIVFSCSREILTPIPIFYGGRLPCEFPFSYPKSIKPHILMTGRDPSQYMIMLAKAANDSIFAADIETCMK
jgi:hypothetical protein